MTQDKINARCQQGGLKCSHYMTALQQGSAEEESFTSWAVKPQR